MDICIAGIKCLFDHISDQIYLATAQHGGDDKLTDRWHHYHGNTTDHPRNAKRNNDPAQDRPLTCPQILCSTDHIIVNLDQCVIDRKHHKRQIIIYSSQNDCPDRIHQMYLSKAKRC